MTTTTETHRQRQRRTTAEYHGAVWALALAAGYIVAVCYSALSHVEVGPMTGNTIATGVNLSAHGFSAAVTRATAVTAFVLGIAAGIVIAEQCARHRVRRVLASTLGVELLLLVAFMWWGLATSRGSTVHATSHWQLDSLVALPAIAMGLQTAALRRVGGQTVRTVYVSGVLTRATEEAVRFAYWRHDRRHGATEPPWRNEPTLSRLGLLAGIFVTYIAGVLIGARVQTAWHLWALALPLMLLAAVALVDAALDAGPPSR